MVRSKQRSRKRELDESRLAEHTRADLLAKLNSLRPLRIEGDIGSYLEKLCDFAESDALRPGLRAPRTVAAERETLRIAVPDGHAQRHTVAALAEAGIAFEGYEEGRAVRHPTSTIEGVEVKVMRPQDMPRAVALGLFDLALTGRDWLAVYGAIFPASPVVELCNLRRSVYRLGAASDDAAARSHAEGLLQRDRMA